MRAWLLPTLGGIDKLALQDVPEPAPREREVVLAVEFAALNPADRYLAEGQYPARPALPHVLGRDGIGTVLAVGPEVNGWRSGDAALILRGEVGVTRWGTFAQRVAVPVESLVHPPGGWTHEQAAAAPLVYMTAYQALTQWETPAAPPEESKVVLVTGASGGVGVATVQLARCMGHMVIVLSRSAEKRGRLAQLGAALCADPDDTQWRRHLREFLGQRRVDLAVDNIGGTLFSDVLDTLGMHGRVSVVGRLAGPVPNFNTASLFFRRIRIGGVAVGTYSPEETRHVWQIVVALLDKAAQRPLVDSIWPLEDLPQAFAKLARGPMGKVLVRVI